MLLGSFRTWRNEAAACARYFISLHPVHWHFAYRPKLVTCTFIVAKSF